MSFLMQRQRLGTATGRKPCGSLIAAESKGESKGEKVKTWCENLSRVLVM
jgi:hypothetical protein